MTPADEKRSTLLDTAAGKPLSVEGTTTVSASFSPFRASAGFSPASTARLISGRSIWTSPILGLLFVVARGGLLRSLWFYWLTVATVRAAGTAVGDLVASRGMLGLPLSTLVTGVIFVGLLIAWKEPARPKLVEAGT